MVSKPSDQMVDTWPRMLRMSKVMYPEREHGEFHEQTAVGRMEKERARGCRGSFWHFWKAVEEAGSSSSYHSLLANKQ